MSAVKGNPRAHGGRKRAPRREDGCLLRLYVAGQTPKSLVAFKNLKAICRDRLGGRYHIEVVDLLRDPGRAREDQILAIPTLVRRFPPPIRRIIGDLSDAEKVLVGLSMEGIDAR